MIVILVFASGYLLHLTFQQWYGGEIMCRLLKFLFVLGFKLSGAMIASIGLDRFLSILFPFVTGTNRQRTKIIVGCAWIYSVVLSAPTLFLWTVKEDCLGQKRCITIYNHWIQSGKEGPNDCDLGPESNPSSPVPAIPPFTV